MSSNTSNICVRKLDTSGWVEAQVVGNSDYRPAQWSTWINPPPFQCPLGNICFSPYCFSRTLEITMDSIKEADIKVSTNARDMCLPFMVLNIVKISSALTQIRGVHFYDWIIFQHIHQTPCIYSPVHGQLHRFHFLTATNNAGVSF